MKYLFLFTFLYISVYCKVQQTYPLNTDYEDIPSNSYLKDIKNELSPYVGVYKANFQGNEITLFISKDEHRFIKRVNKEFYRDILIIRYMIKNSSGQILQDIQNMQFPSSQSSYNFIQSIATNPLQNKVTFIYSGSNCGVGWGKIIIKKNSATQISWTYRANSTVTSAQNCPGNPDLTIYLPLTENLIFTKQ